jgi:arylsulfatase A-like enzyme
LVDVAPSLLHLLELPLPEDLDGDILWDLFHETSEVRKREPLYGPAAQLDSDSVRKSAQEHDMAIVESRLRDLGYLD